MQKNLYQVWYQGEDQLKKDARESMENWRRMNPDWNYILADRAILEAACEDYSANCARVFREMNVMHLRIDLGRYVILYLNGGIYVDMDMFPIHHLDRLQDIWDKPPPILAMTTMNVHPIESIFFVGHTTALNNSMMISSPRHPILHDLIEAVCHKWDKIRNLGWHPYHRIQHVTGPVFLNKFYNSHPHKEGITILPRHLFEPCPIQGSCDVRHDTMAIHNVKLSWVNNIGHYIRAYYTVKSYFFIITVILIIMIFALVIYQCRCRLKH